MANLNFLVSVAVALLVIYIGYQFFNGGPDIQSAKDPSLGAFGGAASNDDGESSRNIVQTMNRNKKNVVVFYGSQTGTAEDYASKLAKELSAKFGLKAMTADPDNYDFENLDEFKEDFLAVFLMASYGEGDPTDNAQELMTFLTSSPEFSQGGQEIGNVNFAVFGLGNSSYEFYNKVGKDTYDALVALGAKPLAEYGQGDDGKGTLEEDFLAWKDSFFTALVSKWGVEEREAVYEPAIEVTNVTNLSVASPDVYLGEPNLKHLVASKEAVTTGSFVQPKGPITPSNPLLAKVLNTRELFNQSNTDRHCVHLELDISGLKYITGDHLAFWCQNSNDEIERFARAFGLTDLNRVIRIGILDKTADVRVPSPTTYDTIIRYYLEINGAVSRQVLSSVAPFAPNERVKEATKKLASDKERFATEVTSKCYNIARLMLHLSSGEPWTKVPFSFVVETIPHLQPRFYSISSSSLEDPNKLSVTAVVERQNPAGADHEIKGVATNNILAFHEALEGKQQSEYRLTRPWRGMDKASSPDIHVPVHVRRSLFKLPAKSNAPIIMVGPGTGAAPFRGFVRERAAQLAKGKEVGKSLLFFGSRRSDEDFLYSEEWSQHKSWLEVFTAFSREGPNKVYVQHRLKENAALVNKLLEEGATFYVCGDASRMARDVHNTLLEIIAEQRGISPEEADKAVRKLRSRNKYQEDVW